jgi:TonB-dependent siderophore receptor
MRVVTTRLLRMGLLGGLTACAFTAPGWAEEAKADAAAGEPTPAAVFEEEVLAVGERPDIPTSNTVATKLPLALVRTPASVAVVPGSILEQQDALILGDALENVAGMNVQTGNGTFDFFTVRGLDSVSSTLILTDGAPEPESSFYQLYNVERVEVLKGPSAFVYGGGPLGGTVNLVRKQPESQGFTRVGLRGGSFGQAGLEADANVPLSDTVGLRLNGQLRESDGYRDGRGSEVWSVNPVLSWEVSDATRVSSSFEHLDLRNDPDSGLPLVFFLTPEPFVADVDRETSYQSGLDTSEQEIDRFQVDVESRLSDRLLVRNKTYYRSFDWLSRATTLNGAFPNAAGGLTVNRTLLSLDDDQSFLGNQLEAVYETGGDRVTHSLLFGLEAQRLTDEFTFGVDFLTPTPLLDPMPDEGPLFSLPEQARAADAEIEVLAPYVVDQISFEGGAADFQLLVGARYDDVSVDDALSGVGLSEGRLSPLVGVVVTPGATTSLYASFSEAFAAPSTFGLTPGLEAEESRQVEGGVKKSFANGRGRATLAVFDIARENVSIPDATGIFRQTGDQEARGVELETLASLPGGYDLIASYAWTDAELNEFREIVPAGRDAFLIVDRSGNEPAFTPEHLANLWLSKRFSAFLGGGVGGGVGARYVGEQFIDEDNEFATDDHVTLRLGAWWDRGPWRLSVHLDNLTDEEYLTRGFGNSSVIPAPGFSATGGIDYRF